MANGKKVEIMDFFDVKLQPQIPHQFSLTVGCVGDAEEEKRATILHQIHENMVLRKN